MVLRSKVADAKNAHNSHKNSRYTDEDDSWSCRAACELAWYSYSRTVVYGAALYRTVRRATGRAYIANVLRYKGSRVRYRSDYTVYVSTRTVAYSTDATGTGTGPEPDRPRWGSGVRSGLSGRVTGRGVLD